MAKCPHCKQAVTLDRAKREVAEAPDQVHKDVVGIMKLEIMYSCPHCECILGFGYFRTGPFTQRPS